ncbi:hypothetical protein WA026_022962 [Henosepilachna vigintioctopunctata]|uniref:Uncharacterized protein n=1 Tax=Henosepilachna vigintioctopunctata TaxID=420089 RepID=A0AAW1TYV9_9CUCU
MEAESKKAFSSAISNTITNISEVCTQTESIIIGTETKYGEDNFGTRDATESTPASCNSDIGDIVSDSFEMSALQNVSAKYGEDNFGTRDATESTPASCNSDIGDIVSDSFEMSALQNVSAKYGEDNFGTRDATESTPASCNSDIGDIVSDSFEMSALQNVSAKYGEDNFGTRNVTESTSASCNSDIGDIVPDNFEMSAVQNVPGPCILIEDIHFDAKGNIVKRKMYKNDSKIDENKFSGKKKEYCIFCKSFKTHLARHFTTCHKNERRVKNFMYLPLKSLERRKKIEELRKEGQLENNSQRNPELIMSVRRPKNKGTDLKDLRICPYCKGYYRRLRAHIPLCKADAKNKRNINVLGRQCSQNLHHLASDKIKSIFSVMRPDIVFSMISQDELVIRCANRWASKYRHVKDENMIRARALGNF